MKPLFGGRETLKSRFFKNMFLSYSIIILLSFVAYSGTVIYESVKVRREQSEQYYNTKAQALTNAMDHQLYSAQNIITNLNTSSLINKFYMNTVMNKTVDSYLLYQVLNDIRLQKTASDNLNIYDIALIVNGYDKVYTSSEVIQLKDKAEIGKDENFTLEVTDLNTLLSMSNNQLVFYKNYFIYRGSYRYGYGSGRGIICVLYEKDKIDSLIHSITGDAAGYTFYFNGDPIIKSGIQKGRSFKVKSQINDAFSYEIIADNSEFGLQFSSFSSVALLFGFLVCMIYLILAYVFAYRYSSPFQSIRKLIGRGEKEEKDESKRIVAGVAQVLGERNGYLEQVTTISPYAEQGVLHSMISGNIDRENLNLLSLKDFVRLKYLFFSVAVVDIAYIGNEVFGKEEVKKIKKMIELLAKEQSSDETKILCYERDFFHVYIILNSDSGEKLEDILYEFFEQMQNRVENEDYVLTMGVEEVKEELGEVSTACERAMLSLERILLEGRGGVYFYEAALECSINYYFPKEALKRLTKSLKERSEVELLNLLDEIKEKNRDEELSSTAIQLLLSEWYMTSIKAVQSLNVQYGLLLPVVKIPERMPIEEVIEYYENYYLDIMEKMKDTSSEKEKMQQLDRDILLYIEQNDKKSDISLTQIAELFDVSSKYVTSLVKQQFGITYLQYVQERRIAYAVELLKTSEISLEKIAEECGYTNILTFRRNFKSIMKKNPSDYRGG